MEFLIENASSFGGYVDNVIVMIAVLTGFWLIAAELVLLYFCFKFRAKNNAKSQYITGEKKEEAKWIHIPHYAVLVCDVAVIVGAIWVWHHIKINRPPADEVIQVVGRQWSWVFTHPGLDKKLGTEDDVTTVDELHLKVNKTYHFKLYSDDVMHSFSIPVFRLKQDAVPGREITGWFKPTKVGVYDLQCAEMCGIGHGIMMSRVHVEDESKHVAWLNSRKG